jgi:hypothetical protein
VPTPEITSYRDPLDLLRRFAPTPLKTHMKLDFATVLLETNDLSFFPSPWQPHVQSPRNPLPSANSAQSTHCLWKIVRDVDVDHKITETSIVMAGSLIVYSMGPACVIGADRERKEILAFIGLEVDARTFRESILPALCRLTEFVMRQETPQALRAAEVAVGGRYNA